MSSKIERLSNSSDQEDFLIRFSQVQHNVYANSDRKIPNASYWVYLNQIFESTPKELFVYSENGPDIGRICVNLTKYKDDVAFFGMVEYPKDRKDIIQALINEATDWAKARGIKKIIGPVDLNVWFGNRFKAEGSELEFNWEPTNSSEYIADFLENGYQLDQDYLSCFYASSDAAYSRSKPSYEKAIEAGCTFRNIDLSRDGEIDLLYKLNIAGFSVNYLYEPITREQYEQTHIRFLNGFDFKYSFFIIDKDGNEMGYIYSFIDQGYHIIKSILMDPKSQGAKFASALVHKSFSSSRADGILKGAGAMVRKGNVSEYFFKNMGDTPEFTHTYTMVAKDI